MTHPLVYIHPTACVDRTFSLTEPDEFIQPGVKIWHWTHVRDSVRIGENTSIGQCCYIDSNVTIGKNCKIQNGVNIYQGVDIRDDCFIGPNVQFTNDKHPSAINPNWEITETVVFNRASIGAGAVIVCGVYLGNNCTIGAGAVVTKDVPAGETWVGNPAKKLLA